MAKFIEVKSICSASHRVQGEDVYERVEVPIIINTDQILTIIPQGETCIITFPGDNQNIHVADTAQFVMDQINYNL